MGTHQVHRGGIYGVYMGYVAYLDWESLLGVTPGALCGQTGNLGQICPMKGISPIRSPSLQQPHTPPALCL